ncbi:MAG: hypothetical protein EZS28_020587 [Streblomastix strix]|uniref:Uncharacterized protein n=1 Tax=Streblomastix strix TaxID=222440 RepID=A0A5J4VML7_9EUKA|nr:MAG: hypothetical protein EZS28_020587 [Streblomastix strix]
MTNFFTPHKQISGFGQPLQQGSMLGEQQQQGVLFGQALQQNSAFGQVQQPQQSLFGQQSSNLFGEQNQPQVPLKVMRQELDKKIAMRKNKKNKNRFASKLAQELIEQNTQISSESEQGIKRQWSLIEAKIFECEILKDSNVAINAVNGGIIADFISWGLETNGNREIQFEIWSIILQILKVWNKNKIGQGRNTFLFGSNESNEDKIVNSIVSLMSQDFAIGIVNLSFSEDIEISAQIFAGIKNSLKNAGKSKERIASDLAKQQIIEILIKPFMNEEDNAVKSIQTTLSSSSLQQIMQMLGSSSSSSLSS